MVSKYQRFQVESVHRSQLSPAPYNPRVIDRHARKKLKEKIAKGGLVEPLVWNRRTGHLVGGHQRLSILDELEGTLDYSLDVSVVDVDEKREKELNVFLNNSAAMGSWDFDLLTELVTDPVIDMKALGFDLVDLHVMLGKDIFDPANDAGGEMASQLSDMKDQSKVSDQSAAAINKIKEARREHKAEKQKADDTEFYLVAVFGDRGELDRFLKAVGLPLDERYVDGRRLAANVGVDMDKIE